MRTKRLLALGLALALLSLTQPLAAAGPGSRAGKTQKDYGLFLNILPPGQGTSTTASDAARNQATGYIPTHDNDQSSMYAKLILAKTLTDAELHRYYKAETFTVGPKHVEGVETIPHPNVHVVRDNFGVPHIYGKTRGAAMFAAGYVMAEDRLFMADVLRHIGRGRLSEFLGPSDMALDMDRDTYRVAGYSNKEFRRQVTRLKRFGPPGRQAIADGYSFIKGINARIAQDVADPNKMPAEYAALQQTPKDWRPTDVVAIAELIQAIFAAGGGRELENAIFLRRAQAKLGPRRGRRLFRDMRQAEDPRAPVTAGRRFPFLGPHKVSPRAVAVPNPKSVTVFNPVSAQPGTGGGPVAPAFVRPPNLRSLDPLEDLRYRLGQLGITFTGAESNWLAVTGRHTASGHPIAVMGPQVGYFSPEILMEIDIHAPHLDARGATFPGISQYVLLGRGPDFAWSATSGISDLVDVRAERLCKPGGGKPRVSSTYYRYRGKCRQMHLRTDRWIAKTTASAQNEPKEVTAHVQRTVHGPVIARGVVRGHPVAFSYQRSTFFGELDSAVTFVLTNGFKGGQVHDPKSFRHAFSYLTGSFNWLYVDNRNVAYYHSGKYPIRAPGVDYNLPSWGTGAWEWRGFVPTRRHPHAVNPKKGWIDSWNNKPARGWHTADETWSFGPVHRVEMLTKRLAPLVRRGDVHPSGMVNVMRQAATVDLRGQEVLPYLLKALGYGTRLDRYRRLLSEWVRHGAHRLDRNGDGTYESYPAAALMDAWWPKLIHAMFDRRLKGLYAGVGAPFDDPGRRTGLGSSFLEGYYSYVQKAVRQALGAHVPGPYRVLQCADGTRRGCRKALRESLFAAVSKLGADPRTWDAHEGGEAIDFSAVGVVDVPNIPWQNRPTFQQVVQVRRHR
jgi:acyl-homoserine lactone acylase PvdQ